MKNNWFYIIMAMFGLVACGGGGSNSSGSDSGVINPPPIAPVKNKLSVKVENKDYCGNTTMNTDARIIIHNTDFTTKEMIVPNSMGELTYESVDEKATITIVYPNAKLTANGYQTMLATTYIDHPLKQMANIYSDSSDKSQCVCQNSNFKIVVKNTPFDENVIVKLNGRAAVNSTLTDEGIAVTDYEVCKNVVGNWPSLTAVVTNEEFNTSVAAYSKNYIPNTDLSTDFIGSAFNINIENENVFDFIRLSMSAYEKGKRIWYDTDNIYNYPIEGIEQKYLFAYTYDSTYYDDEIGSITLVHAGKKKVAGLNASLSLPEVELEQLLPIFFDNYGEFNASQFAEYDYLDFYSFAVNSKNETIVSWSVVAPIISDLSLLENVDLSIVSDHLTLDPDINFLAFGVTLDSYQNIHGYQDYLTHKSTQYSHDINETLWDDNHFLDVYMTVDANSFNFGFDSMNFDVVKNEGSTKFSHGLDKSRTKYLMSNTKFKDIFDKKLNN